ncbi:MAG: hypothetical protein LUC37_06810 [Prevotella sp.]|nr:hypothetical protein [Prevotella sp.]
MQGFCEALENEDYSGAVSLLSTLFYSRLNSYLETLPTSWHGSDCTADRNAFESLVGGPDMSGSITYDIK